MSVPHVVQLLAVARDSGSADKIGSLHAPYFSYQGEVLVQKYSSVFQLLAYGKLDSYEISDYL